MASASIPELDELGSDWLVMPRLLNLPSVSNFHGSLQVTGNLLAWTYLTVPPVAHAGAHPCARLFVDGTEVRAWRCRWYPYQVVREATHAELLWRSTIRMGFETGLVLVRLELENPSEVAKEAAISVLLEPRMRVFDSTWSWDTPRPPADAGAYHSDLIRNGAMLAVYDTGSDAMSAFSFPVAPGALTQHAGGGRAHWDVNVAPGATVAIEIAMSTGRSGALTVAAARSAGEEFEKAFTAAKTGWERRYLDALTPGNGHYSGHLPTLTTDDENLRRVYYMSIVSLLQMERTNLPVARRYYVTAAPQNASTVAYFWDTGLCAEVLALLDPDMLRDQVVNWLAHDTRRGYAIDGLSGALVGPWYAANDLAVFSTALHYLAVNRDDGFLHENVAGRSVLDHLVGLATRWKSRVHPATGLADYGGIENLLEEVPHYVEQVPSLNAANIWMMRQAARLCEDCGREDIAAELRRGAQELASRVLGLYVEGHGTWQCAYGSGERVTVGHVYDFLTIGGLIPEELSSSRRSEMIEFFNSKLRADGWLRALAVDDQDAPESVRPDHGCNGAYDGWVAHAARALARLGRPRDAVDLLRSCEAVTREGPFTQSHHLLPAAQGVLIWDRAELDAPAGFILETVVRCDVSPHGYVGTVIAKEDGESGFCLGIRPDGSVFLRVAFAAGVRTVTSRPGTVSVHQWHTIVARCDQHRLELCVDGSQVAQEATTGRWAPAHGCDLTVGTHPVDPECPFAGTIRRLRMEDATSARPVADLSFDEGYGDVTADQASGLELPILGGEWVSAPDGHALTFTPDWQSTPRIARRYGQTHTEIVGGAFATVVLTDVFGWDPGNGGPQPRDADLPRRFVGELANIRHGSETYTILSDSSGLILNDAEHPDFSRMS